MVAVARCAVLLLLVATSAMAAYIPSKHHQSVQLSPSVLLMGEYDWAMSVGSDGKPWSRCLDMVWRARSVSKGDRLNFVPTHHWLPSTRGFGVSGFCYMHTTGVEGDRGRCLPWDTAKRHDFKTAMQYCFAEAMRQGFVVYVRPHLDDGLNRGIWRNGITFSPTQQYNRFSYADIMTTPLAEALRDALKTVAAEGLLTTPPERARPVVYMGLQGEMSATLMRQPREWASLVPLVKSIIGSTHADVKVGVGLNFAALDAVETHSVYASSAVASNTGSGQRGLYNVTQLPFSSKIPPIDGQGVKELLTETVDFLGISAYAPYSGESFALNEFENSAFNVGDSLRVYAKGLELASFVRSDRLELHYGEFGIGGSQDGNMKVARSAYWCARQPWAGIPGPYNPQHDPWSNRELSAFRHRFYSQATEWLSKPNIKTYNVSEVFIWSMASWDVLSIYRESSNAAGSYRDPNIVALLAQHNAAVIGAKVCKYGSKAACDSYGAAKQPPKQVA